MRPFEAERIDLKGPALIEASAGTGKTYSITSLYLRFIMERGLAPENILVVTYTRAATEELREKIRSRVKNAINILQGSRKAISDDFIESLLRSLIEKGHSKKHILGRLETSLISMDQAAIFTIHGFCQRMLKEFAFETGAPVNAEVISSEDELRLLACQEFVRRFYYEDAREELTEWTCSLLNLKKGLPYEMASILKGFISMPQPEIIEKFSISQVMEEHERLKRDVKKLYEKHRDALIELPDLLNSYIKDVFDMFVALCSAAGMPDNTIDVFKKAFSEKADIPKTVSSLVEIVTACATGAEPAFLLDEDGIFDAFSIFNLFSGEFLKAIFNDIFKHLERAKAKNKKEALEYKKKVKDLIDKFLGCFHMIIPRKAARALLKNEIFWGLNQMGLEHEGINDRFLAALICQARDFVEDHVRTQKFEKGIISYDDMLILLKEALKRNPRLAKRLRKRFQVALIDEFQDTDSVQWEIFSSIYPPEKGASLFLIGDPKQAIYGFRGADIFTYLRAKETIPEEKRFSLNVNWRSRPEVLEAINTLFQKMPGQEGSTFFLQGIDYAEIAPCQGPHETVLIETDKRDESAVEVWLFRAKDQDETEDGKEDKNRKKDECDPAILTAREIKRLLYLSSRGKAYFLKRDDKNGHTDKRPVKAGDIAILVRDFVEARQVKEALSNEGVFSIYHGPGSVFDSNEAMEMMCLIRAVSDPTSVSKVSTALATLALGYNARELLETKQDQAKWDQVVTSFEKLREVWLEKGVFAMIFTLFSMFSVPKRLLSIRGGERALTNMRHLAELLSQAEKDNQGPERLIQWLSENRTSPDDRSEDQQLRLETDENLVKIMSYHKSKGLEFPIVFLPYIYNLEPRLKGFDMKFYSKEHQGYVAYIAHEPADPEILEYLDEWRLAALADLSAKDRNDFSLPEVSVEDLAPDPQEEKWLQGLSEVVRLAYVAFTRAKQKIYFFLPDEQAPEFFRQETGHESGVHPEPDLFQAETERDCKPFLTLVKPGERPDNLQSLGLSLGDEDEEGEDARFLALSGLDGIRVISCKDKLEELKAIGEIPFEYEHLKGIQLPKVTRSPLAPWVWRRLSFSSISMALEGQHEQGTPHSDLFSQGPLAEQESHEELEKTSIFSFPRGPRAGDCIHALFEEMDFSWDREKIEEKAKELLNRFDFDQEWAQVLSDVAFKAVSAQLIDGIRLKGLDSRFISKEMEFYLPLSKSHLGELGALFPEMEKGLVKGFIDLAFIHQGSFYCLDYKSNWLGDEPSDYSKENMKKAMDQHKYWLQAAIYLKALGRFFKMEGAGMETPLRMGGAIYLFVRGLTDEATTKDDTRGIFFISPDKLRQMFPALGL